MDRINNFVRHVNGIILLDKPAGMSSNYLLQKVKKIFCAKKAGHTGSLDPIATGMLLVCFGEATKFSRYLIELDKRYQVTAKLGERTNTSDTEGRTISIRPVSINKNILEAALNDFRNINSQIPSMFSALKYHGCPLYKYARKGITIKRKERSIRIYDLQLNKWNKTEIELEIHCSKGTYIRTFIDDLGEYLGCGAHVKTLRRLSIANYPPEKMITFKKLQAINISAPKDPETLAKLDKLLLPIDKAIAYTPTLNLSPNLKNLTNRLIEDDIY